MSPAIPVFDIRFEPEDIEAVERSLRSGWLTAGPRTAELESRFADHLGVRHAVAVSNCTAALHLAYLAVGVGPGDEVIVPSFTFAATATAVLYCGAKPVFADIRGLDDPSIDPDEVAARITPRTRAVAAVHFGGYAAPVDVLAELCDRHDLALIEDTAHAPSATLGGRKLGSFGRVSAFSFFSNKVLPVGEGGLLATDDSEIAAFARVARSHGLSRDSWAKAQRVADGYEVEILGFNYRFDDARSALLLSQLARLEADIARRRDLTFRYRRLLEDVPGTIVPFTDDAVRTSSGYVMPMFVEDVERRDSLRQRLLEHHGIQTTVLYPPVHRFSVYVERFGHISLPRTELAGQSAVMLPMFPHLADEQVDQIVDAVRRELL